jgi:8-oxo-dGTP pyrophosphatase MutT (NUDIX family)
MARIRRNGIRTRITSPYHFSLVSSRTIRVVALGVIRRGEEILVSQLHDPGDDYHFYRPLGGGIEFGELGHEALIREFDEELDVELTDIEYLETYEDVFMFDGRQEHELWRIYEATIVEEWPYERDRMTGRDPEIGEEFPVVWKHPSAFTDSETFYPEELLLLL